MSKSFTFNELFLELIDSVLNVRHRFQNKDINREQMIAEIRVNYLEILDAFCTENKITMISLEQYLSQMNK